jgi:hypothetical protein
MVQKDSGMPLKVVVINFVIQLIKNKSNFFLRISIP